MRVPIYRSQGELTSRSGSVMSNLSVPLKVADAGGELITKGLDAVAKWALQKQDLSDKTQVSKAKTYYQQQLNDFRNKVLNPKNEKDPVFGVNIFQLSPRERENLFDVGKKIIRAQTLQQYGKDIAGRDKKATLTRDLNTVDLNQTNQFNTVINKRIVQQAAASVFKRNDEITQLLTDPTIPPIQRDQLLQEQAQIRGDAVRNGLMTAQQAETLRKKSNLDATKTVIANVAQQNIDQDGVVKRKWIQTLRKDPSEALKGNPNAAAAYEQATPVERQKILEELDKSRNRALNSATAERKLRDEQEEDALNTATSELYIPRRDGEKDDEFFERKQAALGKIEIIVSQNPTILKQSRLEQYRRYASRKLTTERGDPELFNQMLIEVPLFDIKDDQLVPKVTMETIREATSLSSDEQKELIKAVKTAKDKTVRDGITRIRAAVGVLEDLSETLNLQENNDLAKVLGETEQDFRDWAELNRGASRDKFIKKSTELAKKLSGETKQLYQQQYNEAVKRFTNTKDGEAILAHPLVNNDVTRTFDKNIRNRVFKDLMNIDELKGDAEKAGKIYRDFYGRSMKGGDKLQIEATIKSLEEKFRLIGQ